MKTMICYIALLEFLFDFVQDEQLLFLKTMGIHILCQGVAQTAVWLVGSQILRITTDKEQQFNKELLNK